MSCHVVSCSVLSYFVMPCIVMSHTDNYSDFRYTMILLYRVFRYIFGRQPQCFSKPRISLLVCEKNQIGLKPAIPCQNLKKILIESGSVFT